MEKSMVVRFSAVLEIKKPHVETQGGTIAICMLKLGSVKVVKMVNIKKPGRLKRYRVGLVVRTKVH
jgi:hypothetical protein